MENLNTGKYKLFFWKSFKNGTIFVSDVFNILSEV